MLAEIFNERFINLDLRSTTKDGCFEELVEGVAAWRPDLRKDDLLAAVKDREAKLETSVMTGVAVPHGACWGLKETFGAIGYSRSGIDYGARDSKPVHFVFMLFLDKDAPEKHLRILSRLLIFLKSGGLAQLQRAANPREAYDVLRLERLN